MISSLGIWNVTLEYHLVIRLKGTDTGVVDFGVHVRFASLPDVKAGQFERIALIRSLWMQKR